MYSVSIGPKDFATLMGAAYEIAAPVSLALKEMPEVSSIVIRIKSVRGMDEKNRFYAEAILFSDTHLSSEKILTAIKSGSHPIMPAGLDLDQVREIMGWHIAIILLSAGFALDGPAQNPVFRRIESGHHVWGWQVK